MINPDLLRNKTNINRTVLKSESRLDVTELNWFIHVTIHGLSVVCQEDLKGIQDTQGKQDLRDENLKARKKNYINQLCERMVETRDLNLSKTKINTLR